jgi:hypothetical protein
MKSLRSALETSAAETVANIIIGKADLETEWAKWKRRLSPFRSRNALSFTQQYVQGNVQKIMMPKGTGGLSPVPFAQRGARLYEITLIRL